MNDYIFKLNRPCLFKNILLDSETSNAAVKWTPNVLESIFGSEKFTFRVGPNEACKPLLVRLSFILILIYIHIVLVIFENECETIEASIKEFIEWSKNKAESTNPFFQFDTNKYWAYADYKYMSELTNLGLDESVKRFLCKFSIFELQ